MNVNPIFPVLAGLAFAFALGVFAWRLRTFAHLARPVERALPKGSQRKGILYAFTLGMAPWAKESTRRHWLAYGRGVAFHLGIFLGLALFLAAPWLPGLPSTTKVLLGAAVGLGALLGLAGFAARYLDINLKALSSADDYAAVLLVSLFLAAQSLWLFGWLPVAVFYVVSAIAFVYAPFSKIRHCLYYAASRFFFGRFVGSHGVLPHANSLRGDRL